MMKMCRLTDLRSKIVLSTESEHVNRTQRGSMLCRYRLWSLPSSAALFAYNFGGAGVCGPKVRVSLKLRT